MKTYKISLFCLMLLSFVFASCSKDQEASSDRNSTSGKGGSTARITVVGNYIYAVDQNSLISIDITNPEDPTMIQSQTIGAGIETIYPFKNYLFIGSNSGMFMYSLNNPAKPSYLSSFWHSTACDPVIADDSVAFITLRNTEVCNRFVDYKRIEMVNIQDITNPFQIGIYETDTDPYGLDMNDDYLFVCFGTAGFTVFNKHKLINGGISNSIVSKVNDIAAYDVVLYKNILFVTGVTGFYQYDYSDINNIKQISSILAGI